MKKSLNEQASEILEMAEAAGVQSNFFFVTTFKRYQVQMNLLTKLEQAIEDKGLFTQKTYNAGKANTYTNPAISEYNKTATAANSTVTTLINIIRNLRPEDKKQTEVSLADTMAKLLDGIDDETEQPAPAKKAPAKKTPKKAPAKKKTTAKKSATKTTAKKETAANAAE